MTSEFKGMRICLFTSTFLPNKGGVEYVVHYLAKNLVEQGHRVTVLIKGRRQKDDVRFPYLVHRYPGTKGILSIEYINAVHLIIEKFRTHFDILHAHRTYPTGYLGAKLKNFLNVPLIVTPHGDDIQKAPEIKYGMRLNPELEPKIKYSLKKANAITSISDSAKKEILDLVPTATNIYDIPNGVNINNFYTHRNNNIFSQYDFPPNKKIILAVGRNHIIKGYIYLIKAMKHILKKHENAVLIIIGEGTDSLLPLINEMGIRDSVFLLGMIDNRDMPCFYKKSDIFTMPSLIETFGIVLIEAMAAGLPVVGTNVPGVRDLIRDNHNGFLVPSKSPESLAEKISLLIKNENLRKILGKNSRFKAEQYDWKIVASKYVNLYENIIDESRNNCMK